MSHESPSIGADAQTDVVIPANTKRKSHVYLDLRVGGAAHEEEGSFDPSDSVKGWLVNQSTGMTVSPAPELTTRGFGNGVQVFC